MLDPQTLIGTRLGQYEIIRLIGKGGMSSVYEALQRSVNRRVAIKVLPPVFLHDEKFMQRFRREAEMIASLEHFHILPIYDYGEESGIPYIVMRYLDGGTVQDRIKQGPLTWNEIITITEHVADALDYAHSNQVIHRDIKPSNILLDGRGNAYLADFGIARAQEATGQLTGSGLLGTPAYLAPEQSEAGSKPTPLIDIYALGITLFEMLSGKPPYVADTPVQQILMHIKEPVPSLTAANPDIPDQVDAVIHRALAKNPAARYKSATDLARALKAAVQSIPGIEMEGEVPPPPLEVSNPTAVFEDVMYAPPTAALKREQPKKQATFPPALIFLLIGIGVVALIGGIVLLTGLLGLGGDSEETQSQTATALAVANQPTDEPTVLVATTEVPASPTPVLTDTPGPSPIPTDTPPPTDTPVPTDFPSTITQRGATMILIRSGPFIMGNNTGYPRERPEHQVTLADYYIDQTEVTNLFYLACVDAEVCPQPENTDTKTQSNYFGGEFYFNYPVLYISWYDAQAYCRWRGGHLPTEAQWEKAARYDPVTDTSLLFPWGSLAPNGELANYFNLLGQPSETGRFSRGESPSGIQDAAGNAAEWVYDWFQDNYYEQNILENPAGPAEGDFKVHRGGSFRSQGSALTTTFRDYAHPATQEETIGFRCAWTPSGDPTVP